MSKTTIKYDELTGMAEAEEGGTPSHPSKILEDQLTLSQPGGRLCPPYISERPPPQIFRPSAIPELGALCCH